MDHSLFVPLSSSWPVPLLLILPGIWQDPGAHSPGFHPGIPRRARREQRAQPWEPSLGSLPALPGSPPHWVLPVSTAGLPPAAGPSTHDKCQPTLRFLSNEQPVLSVYEISSSSDSASLHRGLGMFRAYATEANFLWKSLKKNWAPELRCEWENSPVRQWGGRLTRGKSSHLCSSLGNTTSWLEAEWRGKNHFRSTEFQTFLPDRIRCPQASALLLWPMVSAACGFFSGKRPGNSNPPLGMEITMREQTKYHSVSKN